MPRALAHNPTARGITPVWVTPKVASPLKPGALERRTIVPQVVVAKFGASGYVALFEIEDAKTVTVLAVRHQREDDYY